jgi:hypothetical protein
MNVTRSLVMCEDSCWAKHTMVPLKPDTTSDLRLPIRSVFRPAAATADCRLLTAD